MGHAKLSVTIPDDIYAQIHAIAAKEKVKLSHLVTEALVDKVRMKREQAYVRQVNQVFNDKAVAGEQHRMAEIVAENTAVSQKTPRGYRKPAACIDQSPASSPRM